MVFVTTEFEVKLASSADIYQLGEEIGDNSIVSFSNMKMFKGSSHLKLKVPELTATVWVLGGFLWMVTDGWE